MTQTTTPAEEADCGLNEAMYRTTDGVRLADTGRRPLTSRVAEEVPIGLHYNQFPHAVVMATPWNLEELAIGFSLTDGICQPDEIGAITQHPQDDGIAVDVRLLPSALARFLQNRQQRTARSFTSCGICGLESIDRLPQPRPTTAPTVTIAAIRDALAALPAHQALNRLTRAAHAAAWVSSSGGILLVREDVGRHNALDKLIGARSRLSERDQDGFCLVTSRCSFEMVQKATASGMGLLVCISAPTGLAIDAARRAGLSLVALARSDSQTVYVGPEPQMAGQKATLST